MPLDKVTIPSYSKKQECFNYISHFLGLVLALFVFVFSLIKFINKEISGLYFIGLIIFVVSMSVVYLVSGIYHLLNKDNPRKKLFRVLDHCLIYLLIAGTYTPICFTLFDKNIIGLILVISEWSGALIGIILNAFFFDKKVVKIISFFLYVALGWLVLFTGGFIYLDKMAFAFILGGGITYTIGALLYALGHKKTYFHCIFHVFVLMSTILQTIGILILM